MGLFILFLSFSLLLGSRMASDAEAGTRTALLLGLSILLAFAYLYLNQI